MHALFPDEHEGDGQARAAKVWNLDGLFPLPRHPLRCPTCCIGWLAVKDWKYHTRNGVGSKAPWRCDVRLKCMTCGCVHQFGVLVPKDTYDRARVRVGTRKFATWVHWREGRQLMEEDQ